MDPDGAVAIVGMACRYPGCETLDEFWRILVNGENHIREVTPDRWNVEAFFDPSFETPGKTYAKWAGLIDNAFEWDNAVFNVNEMEAEVMDPQQKLALEVSHKALENAGIPLHDIKGEDVAVYMCQMNADYSNQTVTDIASWTNYEFTGTSPSILANRISYAFDLRGPSVTLDTACSGSMVAVHLGAHSILSGESSIALCGGSNFIISPGTFIALSKSRMASPTGQCRAFSAEADGYVKAEGCGVVVLKNLKQALSDGDRIWGIVKTAIASDGHAESPITNPSKQQLQSLITKACSKAKIDPQIIQYVECHAPSGSIQWRSHTSVRINTTHSQPGTGTAAGDPTEAWGVGSVIGQRKKQKGLPAIPIGSVKTNIGHLESAAGTAGLFKVILMMKHGKLVPSLHSERLNPKIDFEGLHVRVCREVRDLGYVDDSKKMRVVSVNSNGFGGTAVHSIVQQEQSMVNPVVPAQEGKDLPFLFTAVTRKALKMTILDTVEALTSNKIKSLYQLSNTSTMKRTQYPVRHVSFARTREELLKTLKLIEHKENVGQKSIEKLGNIVFVFCGMGSHWNKMGERLYAESDIFRNTTDAVQNILDTFEPRVNLLNCFKGEHVLSDPFYGQPAIFSIQVGLFEMFKAKQISPSVILGHSVGEVAAAYCARILSLEQAVRVIYHRGNALQKVAGGAMLVIGKLQIEKVTKLMSQTNSTLDMAAENSPTSCTLSGEKEAISQMEKEIARHYGDGVFLRTLDVKVAYHSKYMDQIANELQDKLHDLQPEMENPHVKIMSTVTGKETMRSEMCKATYWQQNLRNGVLFRQAFSRSMSTKGHNLVIEIGPKPVLRSYIKELASEYQYTHVASMQENIETDQINRTICSCLEVQENINWGHYYTKACPVGDYPRYIFQRKYLYKEPEHATSWRKGKMSQSDRYGLYSSSVIHPFITKDKAAPSDLVRFVANFTVTATPYVFEHKLDDIQLVPGGTYPEIAYAVVPNFEGRQGGYGITIEVDFIRPLVVNAGEESKEATVTLFTESGKGNTQYEFDVSSGETLHARGIVGIHNTTRQLCSDTFQIQSIQKRCSKTFDQNHLYNCLSKLNFTYGKSLRWAQNGCMSRREVLVQLEVPDHVNLEETTVHPVFVDSLFQMFALLTSNTNDNQMVPSKLGKFTLLQNQRLVKWAYVQVKSRNEFQIQLDGYLLGADGKAVAVCKEMTVSEMGHDSGIIPLENMFQTSWKHIEELPKAAAMNNAGKHIALFVDGKSELENEIKKWKNCSIHMVRRAAEVLQDIEAGNLERCISAEPKLLDCILYGWSLNGSLKKSDNGAGIAAEVARVCMDLLNVLKLLQSASTQIPLYILVNGLFTLQTCSSIDLDLTLNGCLASAIVGMMRTIAVEVPLQDYLIIDMDQMSDLNLLQDVISNATTLSAEVAISHKTLHLSHFTPYSPSVEKLPKTLRLDSTNKVDLVQSSGNGAGYVLKLHKESAQTNMTPALDNLQELILDSAFIDNTRSPSNVPGPSNITAFDVVGHDCEGKRYIALYPVNVTTDKTKVPVSNCIPMSTFPSSVPTLSFWVMAWSICSTAQLSREDVPWIVIGSYEDHPICETIRSLAKAITRSDEAEREDATTVIMYINMLDELPNIYTELPNCQNLFVITKTPALCEMMSRLHEGAQLKYSMPIDEVLSSALNYFTPSFKNWINGQDSQRIVHMINTFMKKFQEDVTCINIAAVEDSGLHNYVVLDFKPENDHFNVRLTEQSLFRRDGSYLIVGGSKGLGFELAQHMAKNGAGRIGILSRSGIQAELRETFDSIASQHHCEFVEIKADVTNERELHEKTRQFMSSTRFLLRGVFFGAVVLHDYTMANMTEEIFKKVLYPKVAGAWNMLNLCRDCNLDYFLLHSSIISMCGNVGQCNYAAANAFLDGLAHYARKVTGTGQSICWGALDLGLLENNQATRMKLASRGMIPMKRYDIIRCFNHALLYNPGVAGYSKFNFPSLTREIRKLPIAAQKTYWWISHRKGHYVKNSSITASQMTASGSVMYVKQLVHTITMIEEDDVDMNNSLEYLGADSHQIITIYSQLVKDFGKVPNLSVVDIPLKTLAELASMIEQESDNSEKVTNSSEPVKTKLDKAHQERLPHDSDKSSFKQNVPEPQNDSLDSKSPIVKPMAKEIEKVDPPGKGHCNGSIVQKAMNVEVQNKDIITNTQNPTTADKPGRTKINQVENAAKDRDGEVTLDHMKHGAHVYVDTKCKQAKISVCEKHGGFMVTLEGADVDSVHDIKSLVKAEAKRVTGKNSELHCLRLQWTNKKWTTVYSDNAALLRGWKEGLMKLKTRVSSNTQPVFKKSTHCVIL